MILYTSEKPGYKVNSGSVIYFSDIRKSTNVVQLSKQGILPFPIRIDSMSGNTRFHAMIGP